MVTAANGASPFYASVNNEARYESKEEAIEKDYRIQEAYQGHSRLYIIDNNCSDFDAKIKRAQVKVLQTLGHDTGETFFKKYLLRKVPPGKQMLNKFGNTKVMPIALGKVSFESIEKQEVFLKVEK